MFGSEIRVDSRTVANLGLKQKQWFELMVQKHNMTGHGGLVGNSQKTCSPESLQNAFYLVLLKTLSRLCCFI